jgi:hypothetical protein
MRIFTLGALPAEPPFASDTVPFEEHPEMIKVIERSSRNAPFKMAVFFTTCTPFNQFILGYR